MIRSIATLFVLCLSVSLLAACSDSSDPTAALPPTRALNGTFTGPLSVPLASEDWSTVTMVLSTRTNVSGTIQPKTGVERPIGGTNAGTNLILGVGNLPQAEACYEVTLNIFRFEYDVANDVVAFEGTLSGSCQGTLAGGFRMVRQ